METQTKLEICYTFGLLAFFGLGDAFVFFGDKTLVRYLAINIVPNALIPAALTLLYLRWSILYPRFLNKLEFTPIKSRYYKTKYVMEVSFSYMWFVVDMVCLVLFAVGFFTEGWNMWRDGTAGLQFIEKFYTLWAVPFFAILSYFLTNKKF